MIIINEKMPTNCYECWIRNIIVCKITNADGWRNNKRANKFTNADGWRNNKRANKCPILTDEEIQKLQELEQAQLEKAFELGKESI